MFTHKEIGLILVFESVDTEHDMACWMKDVERLPGLRAALVMREVLMNKIKPPLAHREELELLEEEFEKKLADVEELVTAAEARVEQSKVWAEG